VVPPAFERKEGKEYKWRNDNFSASTAHDSNDVPWLDLCYNQTVNKKK
jgi:hypothetical protein